MKYIYQLNNWTLFNFSIQELLPYLSKFRSNQSKLIGEIEHLTPKAQEEIITKMNSDELINSYAIEGEKLPLEQVAYSVTQQLNLNFKTGVGANNQTKVAVEVMLDAVQFPNRNLTHKRIKEWHKKLFEGKKLLNHHFTAGDYRKSKSPMQVVQDVGSETIIHYEAPQAKDVQSLMSEFLKWFKEDLEINGISEFEAKVLKSGIAHFWFMTIHPFSDGNGRIGRILSDMLLARADGIKHRYYSVSAQIERDKDSYYTQIKKAQKGDNNDLTEWLIWFVETLDKSIDYSRSEIVLIINRHKFWNQYQHLKFNDRHIKVLTKLLKGSFEGELTNKKWQKITKCSDDIAQRDTKYLVDNEVFQKHGTTKKVYYTLADWTSTSLF